jgi:hypothetical protein
MPSIMRKQTIGKLNFVKLFYDGFKSIYWPFTALHEPIIPHNKMQLVFLEFELIPSPHVSLHEGCS